MPPRPRFPKNTREASRCCWFALAVALFVSDRWVTMMAERQTAKSAVAMKSRT